MVLAFMTLYCKHLGFSIQQGGFVVAVYGIGAVAGAYLGGKISDTFGFYFTQFAALCFGGILFIVLCQMRIYEAILICTFCLGMVNESFRQNSHILERTNTLLERIDPPVQVLPKQKAGRITRE